MLSDAELQYFEAICRDLCQPYDQKSRAAAEKALVDFVENPQGLQNCVAVLQKSTEGYPCLFVINSLQKMLAKRNGIQEKDRQALLNFLLNYVDTHRNLDPYMLKNIYLLISRLIKISWFDLNDQIESESQKTVGQLIEMCEYPENRLMAVEMLTALVLEMNTLDEKNIIFKQLRISASFRELYLYDVFKTSVKYLKLIAETVNIFNTGDPQESALLRGLLELSLASFSYDFSNTSSSEDRDERASLMIPSSWREIFLTEDLINIFYTIYTRHAEVGALALDNLVQIASIRRTFLDNDKRRQMLEKMISAITDMLSSNRVPLEGDTFHKFCHLLCRLKGNNHLTEFNKSDKFSEFIEKVATITIQSLMSPDTSTNSLHYLLTFWQYMVTSIVHLKNDKQKTFLENAVSLITQAFIECRLKSDPNAQSCMLEDVTTKWNQMDQFATICRFEYTRTCQMLTENFNQIASAYSVLLNQQQQQQKPEEISLLQDKLSWLVYLIGSAISGRTPFAGIDEHDSKDGEMISRVIQLMKLTSSDLGKRHFSLKLEYAYLWFLYQFRKTYLTDNSPKTSEVFVNLSVVLGFQNEQSNTSLIVDKILENLNHFPGHEELTMKSIDLFGEMCIGHKAAKAMLQLPQVQCIIKSQTLDLFPALSREGDARCLKLRKRFYQTITALIGYAADEMLVTRLITFFVPFKMAIERLREIISVNDESLANQEKTKKAVVSMARDLCGIVESCSIRDSYAKVFDLIYPRCFQIFHRSCELWHSDSSVVVPILRLYSEMCVNRSQRILFSITIPCGYVLFKEAAKLLTTYCSRILNTTDIPSERMYEVCYKGFAICFTMLRNIFCGGFMNFGVFSMYGDTCVNDVLDMVIKVILSIGRENISVYPKLNESYHQLLDTVTQEYVVYIANLEPEIQIYLLETLQDGINNLNSEITARASSTLDKLVAHFYNRYSSLESDWVSGVEFLPQNDNCLKLLRMNHPVMKELLFMIANATLFEECRNTWSLSRPLYGLILLLEQQFEEWKMDVIQKHPVEERSFVEDLLRDLTRELPRSLNAKAKDKYFTLYVSTFRMLYQKRSKRIASLNEVQEMIAA